MYSTRASAMWWEQVLPNDSITPCVYQAESMFHHKKTHTKTTKMCREKQKIERKIAQQKEHTTTEKPNTLTYHKTIFRRKKNILPLQEGWGPLHISFCSSVTRSLCSWQNRTAGPFSLKPLWQAYVAILPSICPLEETCPFTGVSKRGQTNAGKENKNICKNI